ncbi:MAG TPA: hypothetical protein VMX17_07955 [Candidatus Glassbacteria bacterium]|nr:hypothetical protein [Candidatus Glassbacteria bacterium]
MGPKTNIDTVLEEFLDIENDTGPESLESELLRYLIVASLRLEDSASDLSRSSLNSKIVRHAILRGLYNARHMVDDVIFRIEELDKK